MPQKYSTLLNEFLFASDKKISVGFCLIYEMHVERSLLTKLMKVYVNGVLDATNELPLMLWCPRVHTQHSVQTIETPHNYRDNMNEYWHIKVEGAFKYMITCDPKSSTEQGCDYLRFYE